MNDDERFKELKEKEIIRLTTPISYPKFKGFIFRISPKDCEGNPVPRNYFMKRCVLEPKPGILSDDEILMYAPESKESSRIRLKRGIGTFQDKKVLYWETIFYIEIISWSLVMPYIGIISFTYDIFVLKIIFVLFLMILIAYPIYVFYIKDYVEPEYKNVSKPEEKQTENLKASANNDLLLLFESKEKIAREMIEKRFPAPQLTNTKFNAVLDNCKEVVESQIENLNVLTPTEKSKYEIESRKKLIKQVINKVDDLTNELILSEPVILKML